MKTQVKIVNAFIDNNKGGNPAGVVLNADSITHEQKLAIAKKVGLSETAFVSQSTTADFKLDFYTPNRQIAHCGHATIAVFSYLAQIGMVSQGWYVKETIDGNRKILIKNEMAYMQQLAPKYTTIIDQHQPIIDSMGLMNKQILNQPILVNTGNSFVIVGVKNNNILKNLDLDFNAISQISDELDLIGYYIYTTDTIHKENDATTRMFFPRYGVNEESATGMAAGPLASYLYDKTDNKKPSYHFEQGYFMPTPSASKIHIKLDLNKGNEIISLMAGGTANVSKQLTIEI